MIALFARRNHPNYGNSEWMYHGYSIALVRCADTKQVIDVRQHLETVGLPEYFPGHETYEHGWYGGKGWDLITVLDGDIRAEDDDYWCPVRSGNERCSIGDNRYAGIYEAKELLDASNQGHQRTT